MAPVSKRVKRHTCRLSRFRWLRTVILQGSLWSCIVIQHSFCNSHFHPCPFVKSCKAWCCDLFWCSRCNKLFCGCLFLDQIPAPASDFSSIKILLTSLELKVWNQIKKGSQIPPYCISRTEGLDNTA
jgi:hypothetical protein